MPLVGPRIDRPSAIGDEGRPRAASLWIASLVVVVVATVGGFAVGRPVLVPALGTFVGTTIAGVGLSTRERFRPLLAGHVLLVLFGSLLLLWLGFELVVSPFGLAVAGVATAMVGVGVAWANVGSFEAAQNVLVGVAISYVTMLFTLFLLVTFVVVLFAGDFLVDVTTEGVTPVASVTWFLLAVGYAAASLRALLWQFPVAQLVPRDRREALTDRLRPVGWALLAVAVAVPAGVLVTWAAAIAGVVDALIAVAPPLAVVLDALAATPLLGALGVVGTGSAVVVAVVVTARLATRQFDASTARWVAAVASGVCVAGLVVGAFGAVLIVPAISNLLFAVVVLVAVNLGPLTMAGLAPLAMMAVAIGLVPDRAGGPAVAAVGLVVAAVGFAGASSAVAFACVAGAVVVWDLSAFGLGLTAELGHLPETRRLELFHGVIVVGVGLVTVLGVTVVDVVRRTLLAGVGNTAALFLAGVGALLLLLPLRG